MENQLIQIYLLVCDIYDNRSLTCFQRLSNFKPRFSDQEVVAIYLFGHLHGFWQKKQIYQFIKHYWSDWFPALLSYQAYARRLNQLEPTFHALGDYLLAELGQNTDSGLDHLIDSFPVMLAQGVRSRRARVAREAANIGYCAAKRLHFHGVRLHTLAVRRVGKLPLPQQIWLREASVHDLTALKEQHISLPCAAALFGDKAYADAKLESMLKLQGSQLFVPKKKPKGKDLSETGKQWSRFVSCLRQPIESFFNWLNDKTQIQRASTVRSLNGLLVHCFGKLTFALLLLVFYS